jgi:hypothetical protein
VPPGHVNELICRPIFIVAERTSRSWSAPLRGPADEGPPSHMSLESITALNGFVFVSRAAGF